VLIPLYRGRDTIRACIESLIGQEGVEPEILLLDNGCPEDTGEWAGYYLAQLEKERKINWKLYEEPKNIGFAAGMNLLYEKSTEALVCFMNQDVELELSYLKMLADALEESPESEKVAGVTGILFRPGDSEERVIDTAGHVIFRDRIVRNRGKGVTVREGERIPYEDGEVFGLSAACALYRRDALEEAREEEGPFDPDFFAYFEDIDLDYRLHRAGWSMRFVGGARGTHTLAGSGGRRELAIRLRAYGNRRRIMWKHESVGSLMPDVGPILMQDVYGWARSLVTDFPSWLIGPWIFWLSLPKVMDRRRKLDERFGRDRSWIRRWLRPESERLGQ
jgi:GT2 family glycosyltransferase